MDYSKYSEDWKYIRMKVLVRDNFTCSHCGNQPTKSKTSNTKSFYLIVAHLDQDKTNNELSNLLSLCPSCHALLDSSHRSYKRLSNNK